MADQISYRKLPGRRRGFFKSASAWLGPDHLLLVRSMRFREEYKRYQFRDIQAVAIANRPRFHISTRAFAIAVIWSLAYLFLNFSRIPHGTLVAWGAALILVVSWFYVSAVCSCTCRLYTAVSRDELPSVYRTWVAAKFLRALEPQIAAVQGTWQGASSGALAAQEIGPQVPLTPEPASSSARTSSAPISATDYLLTVVLIADGLWHAFALAHPLAWASVMSNLIALAVIGAAILVLVTHRQGGTNPAQRILAIAALISMGLIYYVRVTVVGAVAGARAALEKKSISVDYTGGTFSSKAEMGITLALGLAGLITLIAVRLRQSDSGQESSAG